MTEVKSADLAAAFQQVYNSFNNTPPGHKYIRLSNGKLEVSQEKNGHATFGEISQLVKKSLQSETDISRLMDIKRGYSEIKNHFDNKHRSLWGLFKYVFLGGIGQTQESDRIINEIDDKIIKLHDEMDQKLGEYKEFLFNDLIENFKWEDYPEGSFVICLNEEDGSLTYQQKLPKGEFYTKQISSDFSQAKEEIDGLLRPNKQFLILQEKGLAQGINIDLDGQPFKDIQDLEDRSFTDEELKYNLENFGQLEEKGDFRLYKRWEGEEERYTLFVRGEKDIEIIPIEDTSILISQVVDKRNRIMKEAA